MTLKYSVVREVARTALANVLFRFRMHRWHRANPSIHCKLQHINAEHRVGRHTSPD